LLHNPEPDEKKQPDFFSLFLFSFPLFAQINSGDSTVQVAGHWNVHDRQTYQVTEETHVIKNSTDTISKAKFIYKLEIEILEASTNSYTIQWLSHDYKVIDASDTEMLPFYKLGEIIQNCFPGI